MNSKGELKRRGMAALIQLGLTPQSAVYKCRGYLDEESVREWEKQAKEKLRSKKKEVIKVDNMANFDFWLGIYKYTCPEVEMQKAVLASLEKQLKEAPDKIKALKFLIGDK